MAFFLYFVLCPLIIIVSMVVIHETKHEYKTLLTKRLEKAGYSNIEFDKQCTRHGSHYFEIRYEDMNGLVFENDVHILNLGWGKRKRLLWNGPEAPPFEDLFALETEIIIDDTKGAPLIAAADTIKG